jgi:cytidine deaminase
MNETLFEAAKKVRENAYCPYSEFKVGAALITKSGKIYTGCNVENASYGAAMCAERAAIFKAISEEGKPEIKEIWVVADSDPPTPPCGMCRQVISEFCENIPIHLANIAKKVKTHSSSDLLPEAFSKKFLKL